MSLRGCHSIQQSPALLSSNQLPVACQADTKRAAISSAREGLPIINTTRLQSPELMQLFQITHAC